MSSKSMFVHPRMVSQLLPVMMLNPAFEMKAQ